MPKETHPCECGCGMQVTRTYAPGHDAKHKSALIATVLTSKSKAKVATAEETLEAKGWTKFMTRKRELLLERGKITDVRPTTPRKKREER